MTEKHVLFVLILSSFLISFGAAWDILCDDVTSIGLQMLQTQAHPGHVGETLARTQTASSHHNSTTPRLRHGLEPKSSTFRMLEQEGANQGLEDGIFVIVPGLGDYPRAKLVESNIAWLNNQGLDFECVIYVYQNATVFPLEEERYAPCTLIRHDGYWMNHLIAFPLSQTQKRWILHWLDSVEPDKTNVNFNRMLEIMKANALSHSAPSVSFNDNYKLMVTH